MKIEYLAIILTVKSGVGGQHFAECLGESRLFGNIDKM